MTLFTRIPRQPNMAPVRRWRALRRLLQCIVCGAALAHATLAAAVNIADAYADAKRNDPVLSAAQAGHQARRQLVPQARAGLLPKLNLSGSTSRNKRSFPVPPVQDLNPNSPTFGQVVDIPDQTYNEHVWQVQLNQPIVNLSAWHDLRSAASTVEAAESMLKATDQDLIVRVVRSYLNVLRAQDRLEASQAQETAVKRQLEQVQQRFEVGLVAITDVLEAQAAYDNSAVARIQADGDLHVFFEILETVSGTHYETLDRVAESLPIVNPEPEDEEQWVTAALQGNPKILAAQAQLQAANRSLAARRAGHWPTIDGAVTHNRFVTGGLSFLGDKINTTTYALSFNLPIYQGGFTHARAKEARHLAEQARQELLNQQLTVTRDARNLFQAVATDVVRVGARLKAIASSQSALEATETGYEVGTRNIVDVLLAQQRLYASQFDYADSRYNYVTNLMLLKQAAGGLAEADLMELNQFMESTNPVMRGKPLLSQ